MTGVTNNGVPRVGLVGLGYWGRNLARVLDELGALGALCDTDADRRRAFAEAFPDAVVFDDPRAMIAEGELTAVAIATPPHTHAELATCALTTGMDAFVEKPLCHDADEAERLKHLAMSHNRVLMVGHLLRYHPMFIRLEKLIEDGTLGDVGHIETRRLNLGQIETERSVLWNFAPHDLSLVLAAAGHRLPDSVRAEGHRPLDGKRADAVTLTLRFTDPALSATVHVSWLSPVKESRLTVCGSTGSAVFDDTRPWDQKLCWFDGHNARRDGRLGRDGLPEPRMIDVPPGEPLRDELSHFLTCCRTRSVPRTGPDEAFRVVAVLDAAQRSLDREGEALRLG